MKVFTEWKKPDGGTVLFIDEVNDLPQTPVRAKRMVLSSAGLWTHVPFVEASATVNPVDHGEMKTPAILSMAEKLGIPVVRL